MAVAINGPMPRCSAGHACMPERAHRHQSSGHIIFFGPTGDLGVELSDLHPQMRENRDEHLERGDGIDRQNVFRILDDGDQFRCVGRPPWHNLAELAQMTTSRQRRAFSTTR